MQQLTRLKSTITSEPPRQIVQEIAANIAKVMYDKLATLSQLLQTHTLDLENPGKRTGEAKNRVSAMEKTLGQSSVCIQTLQKEVNELQEHTGDLENRGGRKNLCTLVHLREYKVAEPRFNLKKKAA